MQLHDKLKYHTLSALPAGHPEAFGGRSEALEGESTMDVIDANSPCNKEEKLSYLRNSLLISPKILLFIPTIGLTGYLSVEKFLGIKLPGSLVGGPLL